MSRIFRFAAMVLAILYLVALFLCAIGTFGWFGADEGPLSGAFLTRLGLSSESLGALFFIALLTPVLGIAILMLPSRVAARRNA